MAAPESGVSGGEGGALVDSRRTAGTAAMARLGEGGHSASSEEEKPEEDEEDISGEPSLGRRAQGGEAKRPSIVRARLGPLDLAASDRGPWSRS